MHCFEVRVDCFFFFFIGVKNFYGMFGLKKYKEKRGEERKRKKKKRKIILYRTNENEIDLRREPVRRRGR